MRKTEAQLHLENQSMDPVLYSKWVLDSPVDEMSKQEKWRGNLQQRKKQTETEELFDQHSRDV